MGRSYWFECSRCGYRAQVSGGADDGFNLRVQTIACRECKQLFDAVTWLKVPNENLTGSGLVPLSRRRLKPLIAAQRFKRPPSFEAALNRLLYTGARRFRWLRFKLECPVGKGHKVQSWNEPGRCPRCGLPIDRHGLPYRIWE
jgi:hypothetical protein